MSSAPWIEYHPNRPLWALYAWWGLSAAFAVGITAVVVTHPWLPIWVSWSVVAQVTVPATFIVLGAIWDAWRDVKKRPTNTNLRAMHRAGHYRTIIYRLRAIVAASVVLAMVGLVISIGRPAPWLVWTFLVNALVVILWQTETAIIIKRL